MIGLDQSRMIGVYTKQTEYNLLVSEFLMGFDLIIWGIFVQDVLYRLIIYREKIQVF